MAYQVDKFNGDFLVSVDDGTIETTKTDLRFIGKNYAGYGEVQNENFLHLLENFANTTAPPKVITGQIWYDSANKKLKFYDGSKFKVAGGAEVSATEPSGLQIGEFWWDSTRKQLFTYTGTDFILVGPQTVGTATSSASSFVVTDTANTPHTILKLIAGGRTVAVINQDTAFDLTSAEQLRAGLVPGEFNKIKKGITLANTNTNGVSTADHVMWGTASDSNRLAGFPASSYLKADNLTFEQQVRFLDPGFLLGGSSALDTADLRVNIENGNEIIVESIQGTPITFRITVANTTDERDILVIGQDGIAPAEDGVYDIGTTGSRYDNLYINTVNSTNLIGTLTGNSVGIHQGNIRAADGATIMINAATKQIGYDGATLRGTLFGNVQGNVTGTADNANQLTSYAPSISVPGTSVATIPVRDTSGNLYANRFIGLADTAVRLKIDNAAVDTDPAYRSAKTTATANTIVARNDDGDMFARYFQGTATAAMYADLAEKYLTDAEYEPGTVVMVGGEKEVTASKWGKRAIGVVSTNPAFMMNKDLEGGTYIALKGRVPVKVVGRIKKGEELIAADNGCATMAVPLSDRIFAIALETSDDEGVKVIEALVL